jgi:hypothetical protein
MTVILLSEKQFQHQVTELASLLGWAWWHHLHSQGSKPGIPDLHLMRERLVVAELKRDGGKLTKPQEAMLDTYRRAGIEAYVWRPADWSELQDVLTRRVRPRTEPNQEARP